MKDLGAISATLAAEKLCVLGAFHEDGQTYVMVGPDEPSGFWSHFSTSPEAEDGAINAMDRWSTRVLGNLAAAHGAQAIFPFGGPPYHPFFTWAKRTGRIHESPVRLLVHDVAGLWVSFRGVLVFADENSLPVPPPKPCDTCTSKPCLTACPVGALTGEGYDVPACKSYLADNLQSACMSAGCRVRDACPVSKTWGRVPEQSAFHMKAFLKP